MKKLFAVCLCAGLMFTAGGCRLKDITEKLHINEIKNDVNTAIHKSDSETDSQPEISPEPSRVYMDEISGILQDFSGSTLTMSTSDGTYVFDISQASLECKDGVVTGDEISIIYEGQLTGTDTGSVRVLKVVDEYHPESKLKDRTVRGKVLSLTPNTITIKKKSGSKVTYSITGTKQYYSSGIKKGVTVYLHFKGKAPETDSQDEAGSDTSHLKILSISDVDPFDIPAPTPTPAPNPEQPVPDAEKEQHFMATVQGVDLNRLKIIPNGQQSVQIVDMSSIPSYFRGGITTGSQVKIIYKGELQPETLAGITVLGVTGENPDKIKLKRISYFTSGTVLGTTANTVTIHTYDGAMTTFNITNAQNLSTGELAEGCSINVTFHPSKSKKTNIYTATKITDA